MADPDLGSIETVELRGIFEDEAREFTPWLAEQEHLDLLGEALNLDLSFVQTEGEVGPFRVDVVAESELGIVVIENQLNETDHDHLGKLLTYAAGRDARVLIWVTPKLKDEHRAALDWLNRWIPEDLEIYGVEIRAISIDGSRPAIEFLPVAFPNTWSRHTVARSLGSDMSDEEKDVRKEFFQNLADEATRADLHPTNPRQATKSKSFYCYAPSLRKGFRYWVDLLETQVRVKLEIQTGDVERSRHIYDALFEQQGEIEEGLSFKPAFAPSKRGGRPHVRRARRPAPDLNQSEQLGKTQTWVLETIKEFRDVLEPRLVEIIQPGEPEQGEGVLDGLPGDDVE